MNRFPELTFPDLLELVWKLREQDFFTDNKVLGFYEEVRGGEAQSCWGITPMSLFDDDAYLVGHYGGGDTFAIDLSEYGRTDAKAAFDEVMQEKLCSDTVFLERTAKGDYI